MHRTQLYLPTELHKQLKKDAKEEGVTISEYVRMVLNEYLSKKVRSKAEKGIQTLLKMTEKTA